MFSISSLSDFPVASILYVSLKLFELVFIGRAILRPHREPAARMAWVIVIAVVPVLGIVAYILFGETQIGKSRSLRSKKIMESLANLIPEQTIEPPIPQHYQQLFKTAHSISGFKACEGNSAKLFSNSDESIQSMVNDIDQAKEHVHILFYIWLDDRNGCKMVEALQRAAERGVQCRVMVDALGSKKFLQTRHWLSLKQSGVQTAVAMPIGSLLLRSLRGGRVDLRNHRKIVVIDHRITYCGSQNCADAEFRVKAKYAPWVDAVTRFEGPISTQQQSIFVSDWMTYVDEDIQDLLRHSVEASTGGFIAQAFGTGPSMRFSAMPEMFTSLMFAAQKSILITTPYYVPNESMQHALCAAAMRGVDTRVVFPARNDSFIVAGASRSYYAELLESGVKIFEYVGGVLHTKSFTLDEQITLIGSANMDRRSFDLNYENNILLYDPKMTAELQKLQEFYISKSNPVTQEAVNAWPLSRRLWNHSLGMIGPLL